MIRTLRMLLVCWMYVLVLYVTSFAQTIVFENVSVLSMEHDTLLKQHTVIIQDGMIATVAPTRDVRIPRRATIIRGDYVLMPGLAEMHAHIPSVRSGEAFQKDVLAMYLMQGVTTIRGMLGEASHLELRQKVADGHIPGPKILTSGPSFNSNSVSSAEQAREMVRDQVAAGYDLLKFHPGLKLDEFLAASSEARLHNIEFSGHISYDVGLEVSLASGKGSIDHLDRYMEFLAGDAARRPDPPIIYFGYDLTPYANPEKIALAAQLTAASGVWNVPTNTLLENIFNPDLSVDEMKSWPGMDVMPKETVANWAQFVTRLRSNDDYNEEQARNFLALRRELTLALHKHGAGLLLGADAPQIFNPPGFSVHRELALLVDAGLEPFEAIAAGTTNVGTYLGISDTHGKIKPGYRADIIVLDRNPLENIPFGSYIQGVMTNGVWYDKDTLEALRSAILAR